MQIFVYDGMQRLYFSNDRRNTKTSIVPLRLKKNYIIFAVQKFAQCDMIYDTFLQ
jgi:hypothetical protein